MKYALLSENVIGQIKDPNTALKITSMGLPRWKLDFPDKTSFQKLYHATI